MKQKVLKTLTIATLICCIGMQAAWAAESSECSTRKGDMMTVASDSAVPYTMYYYYGSLGFSKGTNKVYVNVSTKAFQKVDHIYHDITIYKNGTWVSSERYNDWNSNDLMTSISVSAKSGDRIEVYVDHYAEHGGYTEGGHSSDSIIY